MEKLASYVSVVPGRLTEPEIMASLPSAWATLALLPVALALLTRHKLCLLETIALAIGLCEGTLDDLAVGVADLVDAGADKDATAAASTALTPYAAARPPVARTARGMLPAAGVGTRGRL